MTWEAPILAQVGGLELDIATIAQGVQRQMSELGREHVAGDLSDAAYLARMAELRAQLANFDHATNVGVPAERAVAWLRALGKTWRDADVPEEKAELLHAIYERIVIAGPTFVSARLTSAAYAHGLSLALPQVVMASPAGFEPATRCLEGSRSVH
jgi:hypothetical protein